MSIREQGFALDVPSALVHGPEMRQVQKMSTFQKWAVRFVILAGTAFMLIWLGRRIGDINEAGLASQILLFAIGLYTSPGAFLYMAAGGVHGPVSDPVAHLMSSLTTGAVWATLWLFQERRSRSAGSRRHLKARIYSDKEDK